jgi:predicted  nucleic acid-binding Zn-ribbon protein
LFLIAYLKQAYESERERLVMEKDAVANELATLEEQLSASKAQITSLSETLEKQKDKVVQDAVICSLRPKLYVVLTFLGL